MKTATPAGGPTPSDPMAGVEDLVLRLLSDRTLLVAQAFDVIRQFDLSDLDGDELYPELNLAITKLRLVLRDQIP